MTRLTQTVVIPLVASGLLAVTAPVSAAPSAAQPADAPRADAHRATRNALVFGNGIAGALLAGPLGYAAGVLVGDWLGDRVLDGYALDDTEAALVDAEARARSLDRQLAARAADLVELRDAASAALQIPVLFPTDAAEVDADTDQRIRRLARFLATQPQLRVRLTGHADPRGTDRHNDALSAERVARVATLLTERGVSPARISTAALGERAARAAEGDADADAYALQRRVDIEISAAQPAGLADAR